MKAANGWSNVKLGEHVELLTGFPFKSQRFTSDPKDTALVKGENVAQGRIEWEISKRWPSTELPQFGQYRLRSGDVVLAMDRPWIEAGLKYAWIKPHDPVALLVQRVSRLRGKQTLDQTFLRCVIGSPAFTNYIKPIVTGVSVPHISPQQIKDFQFRLPPVEIQRKAATILAAYDDLIENNTRRIKILEEMAQAIYREWFVHFRFPGHDKVKFVASPIGEIPEGWEVMPVPQAVFVNPQTPVPRNGTKPFVPMTSLSTDSMLISDIEARVGNSGAKFRNGDTLFARITPCLENGKTGFVQFLKTDEEVAFGSTEFIVLRSRMLTPEYVYLLGRSKEFRDNAIKSMSGATGRQRVQEECFNKFLIACPKQEQLTTFTEIVRPMFQSIHRLAAKNANLRQTRDLLLPKLISGEVDVSKLDVAA